jgi:hypothetical protein
MAVGRGMGAGDGSPFFADQIPRGPGLHIHWLVPTALSSALCQLCLQLLSFPAHR